MSKLVWISDSHNEHSLYQEYNSIKFAYSNRLPENTPGKQWFYCILNFKQQENEGVKELFEPKILFEVDSKLNNIHLNIQV